METLIGELKSTPTHSKFLYYRCLSFSFFAMMYYDVSCKFMLINDWVFYITIIKNGGLALS